MALTRKDVMDNAKGCIFFEYVTRYRGVDRRTNEVFPVASGICKKRFTGDNYDESKCPFGGNTQEPLMCCVDRMSFEEARAKRIEVPVAPQREIPVDYTRSCPARLVSLPQTQADLRV